jgi:hypothetical protein
LQSLGLAMADHKGLPPIPFAPKKHQPFCLVDGETGLVLATNSNLAAGHDSQAPSARDSIPPPAGSTSGALPS